MTTAVLTTSDATSIPVALIRPGINVRDLDQDHVDGLASSIALLGQLTAVIVAPIPLEARDGAYEYELVAGYHRFAAIQQLGHDTINATLRESLGDMADADTAAAAAAENITRKQLDAYQEALAVKAVLDKGLTEHGVAEALGWHPSRVTARVKLLQLPETAQALVGAGVIALSHVDTLRTIAQASPDVLGLLIEHIEQNPRSAGSLAQDPAALIMNARRWTETKVFVEQLTSIQEYAIDELKLPKGTLAKYDELAALQKKIDGYGYGKPTVRFGELEVDQARAAQVLIECGGAPLIVDKSMYRELVKQAIARQLQEAEATWADRAERRKTDQAELKAERAADPETDIRRDHGRTMRAIADQAHGANTDLGWSLRNNLAVVDPDSMDVARFFVYALLESGHSWAANTDSDRVTQLATTGIRLVVDEFRADVTKTRKDGTRGALRIDYGTPTDSADVREWIWKFIDASKTAGELYGRALVVIAAEHYASRLVVPSSQQRHPLSWDSHKGKAVKALEKLAGPHVPTTLKNIEKAVRKAKADYDKQLTAARQAKHPSEPASDVGEHQDEDELAEDLDDFDA